MKVPVKNKKPFFFLQTHANPFAVYLYHTVAPNKTFRKAEVLSKHFSSALSILFHQMDENGFTNLTVSLNRKCLIKELCI